MGGSEGEEGRRGEEEDYGASVCSHQLPIHTCSVLHDTVQLVTEEDGRQFTFKHSHWK